MTQNRMNVRRKPSARRTSPIKKLMRKQTISPQLARAMEQEKSKGDRRRTVAQRRVRERARRRIASPRNARGSRKAVRPSIGMPNKAAKLLVLVDLGRLKAYRLGQSPVLSTPRLEFLEEWETNVTEHLSTELTDQFGRFRTGSGRGGPGNMSDGEEHNLDLERRRRAAKTLARRIGKLAAKVEGYYFAAAAEINQALLEEMDRGTRAKIEKNVPADLTKARADQIIRHFCE
jgi:hypothetical protein